MCLIHLELISVNVCGKDLHYFACGYSVVPAPSDEQTILTPWNDLGILLKIQLTTDTVFSFQCSQFYSIGLYVCPCASLTLF